MKFLEPDSTELSNDPRDAQLRYREQAAELRLHPGAWGVITTEASSRYIAKHITMGQLAAFRPAGHYQGKARTDRSTGRVAVYARYLGTTDA